jgi:hypothetical protein
MHLDRSPVPAAEVTRSEARQERAYEGGAAITLLSRDCSTHAAEVAQIELSALLGRPGLKPQVAPQSK